MSNVDWNQRASDILKWTSDGRQLDLGDRRRFGLIARKRYPTRRFELHFSAVYQTCDLSLYCQDGGGPARLVHSHPGPTRLPANYRFGWNYMIDSLDRNSYGWAINAFRRPWPSIVRALVAELEPSDLVTYHPDGRDPFPAEWFLDGKSLTKEARNVGTKWVYSQLGPFDELKSWVRRYLDTWEPPVDEVVMDHHAGLCRAVTQSWGPMVVFVSRGEVILRRSFEIEVTRTTTGQPPVQTVTRKVVWGHYLIDHVLTVERELHSWHTRVGKERRSRRCCANAETFVFPTLPDPMSGPHPIPPGTHPASPDSPGLDAHIDGLGSEEEAKLQEAGILTLGDLIEADPETVAEATGYSVELVRQWIEAASEALLED